MLKIISYISFAFAGIFLLLLIGIVFGRFSNKSKKTKEQAMMRARFYGIVGAIFLIAGVALLFLPGEARGLKEFIREETPVEGYEESEEISALPSDIFAAGDDYYIRTGDGKIYGYLAAKDEDKKITYSEGLSYEQGLAVAGGKDVLALLNEAGELMLTGAFEYQKYEKNDTVFSNKLIAENCTYVSGNSNNLMYVSGGKLYTLGYNAFCQLGDGTERSRLEPMEILEKVSSVSVSSTHTLVVDTYGNLYGFGDNSYSEMGNRTTAESATPIRLMGGVKQAAAGQFFSVVLTKNGDVYAAGRNDFGQLGTGDQRDYATYKKVLSDIVKISVGPHSCAALSKNGGLYVWGKNVDGILGLEDEYLTEPTLLMEGVYDVAMGPRSMGIIRLNRDVEFCGIARPKLNRKMIQKVYEFDATIPEEELYRETEEMPAKPSNPKKSEEE